MITSTDPRFAAASIRSCCCLLGDESKRYQLVSSRNSTTPIVGKNQPSLSIRLKSKRERRCFFSCDHQLQLIRPQERTKAILSSTSLPALSKQRTIFQTALVVARENTRSSSVAPFRVTERCFRSVWMTNDELVEHPQSFDISVSYVHASVQGCAAPIYRRFEHPPVSLQRHRSQLDARAGLLLALSGRSSCKRTRADKQ